MQYYYMNNLNKLNFIKSNYKNLFNNEYKLNSIILDYIKKLFYVDEFK